MCMRYRGSSCIAKVGKGSPTIGHQDFLDSFQVQLLLVVNSIHAVPLNYCPILLFLLWKSHFKVYLLVLVSELPLKMLTAVARKSLKMVLSHVS